MYMLHKDFGENMMPVDNGGVSAFDNLGHFGIGRNTNLRNFMSF